MTTKETLASQQWTGVQAYTLAVICLLLGVAGGWLIRASGPGSPAQPASASAPESTEKAAQGMTPERLKQMADIQAQPLLEELKKDPSDVALLARIGNLYYDAQQYPSAIEFYQRALKAKPENTDIRTDMATAYWYAGDTDTAIVELKKSLSYQPNKVNTLFNLGMVQWQGKMDVPAAVATWQKLLDTNPNFEGRAKVEELIAQAKKHSNIDMQKGANASR
ncbi:MAG TPA: tetratricopeptide repeat protein [Terriglobales bacterium]|nr:tetratricopeptide repeat protein [Terriglobales bacterium]